MPILNMVGGGKKGGNIGEPLNLTVTSAGLDATITWEDNEIGTIPPTSFVKSELVRKIGSAPTSPSDGVLVVTETVKDTYKTIGYVDQGLTDGETYYYRVFSYSDLGGISYCDAVSVTPSAGGWQPGVNTLAYYHIEADDDTTIHDRSGNNNDLSYTANSYTTDADAGKVMDCNGSNYAATSTIINLGNTYTEICWVYYNGASGNRAVYGQAASSSKWAATALFMDAGKIGVISSDWYGTSVSMPVGVWTLWAITRDNNGNIVSYLNGQYVATKSGTAAPDYSSGQGLHLGAHRDDNAVWDGKIKTLILEDRERTATEISDYYDQTKGDYGIS